MNATTKSSVSSALLAAPSQLNMWFGCFILITGNISTFGNIIVFSARSFRKRACTIYLLAEAFVLIIFFDFVLLTRTLQKGFLIPVLNRYDAVCRIRYFASQYTNLVAISLFILASLDRLLATQRSQALRRWSGRTDLAYKLVPACIVIWFLITCHRLALYSAATGRCIARPGIYAAIDNYFEAVVSGFSPPIIIFILSYLLLRSVRSTVQRQVMPGNTEQNKAAPNLAFLKKTDKQLTQMLLWQTFVAIPAFLPYAGELIYDNVTLNWSKSPEWQAWESVIIETIRLLSYTFFSTRFYVSLASSHGIRKQIINIFIKKNRIGTTNYTMNTVNGTAAGGVTHHEL